MKLGDKMVNYRVCAFVHNTIKMKITEIGFNTYQQVSL
mgnify:CR=1 FL=1